MKYIKSVLWRVAKRLSYIEDARCLRVKPAYNQPLSRMTALRHVEAKRGSAQKAPASTG